MQLRACPDDRAHSGANMTAKPPRKKAPAKAGAISEWRDASQYPDEQSLLAEWRAQGYFPDDRTLLSMWRWEFLRRRSDYQAAYAEQEARSQAYWDQCFTTDGVMSPEQDRSDFNALGARHLSTIADDYGLEFVPSPRWNYRIQHGGLFKRSFGWAYSAASANATDTRGRHVIDARLEDDQMLVAFDLGLPLNDQLARAKEHLEAIQQERFGAPLKGSRHHRSKWAGYLRALDARAAGATFECIWEAIGLAGASQQEFDASAEKQNWTASGRQLWQQATELMDRLAPKT